LERKKRDFEREKKEFEDFKQREMAIIDNVKQMYSKHIEYFMLIKEVLEKYQLTPT
jgi:hypothetical protein